MRLGVIISDLVFLLALSATFSLGVFVTLSPGLGVFIVVCLKLVTADLITWIVRSSGSRRQRGHWNCGPPVSFSCLCLDLRRLLGWV